MIVRKWGMGIVVAAALIPLSANALTVPNVTAGSDPTDALKLHFLGVTGDTANASLFGPDPGGNPNGGSCTGAGGTGTCLETTFGAGVLQDVVDVSQGSTTLWTGATPGHSQTDGMAIGFVIYGIADASVVVTGATTESIDSTGATASGGLIHIDFYYMSGANSPCFGTGSLTCTNLITPATVGAVTSTANSDVFGTAVTAPLFASFTLQSGAVPLNTAADGASNGNIAAPHTFDASDTTGVAKGIYMNCTGGPGCSEFSTVSESTLDGVSGYSGDPTFAALAAQLYDQFNTTAPSTDKRNCEGAGPCGTTLVGAGWTTQISDPGNAFAPIPEPASLGLLGTALAFLGVAIHRRRKGMSA